MYKVSVIVPVYNCEKYLRKCIESIINQTLEDLEIILINDGSTDNSGKILDEYKSKDSRIKVIHKKNEGQSVARNIGLNIATGTYIGFVDSDDWIDSKMYENLYNAINKSQSDVAVCGRQACTETGKLSYKSSIQDEVFHFKNESLENYIISRLFYKHTVVVWNKLYRKELIDIYNLRFENVDYVGSEDALFNYKILCHTNKLIAINNIYYNQLSREGSTARSYKYGYIQRTGNLIKCMEEYSKNINKNILPKDIFPIVLLFFHQWNMSQIKTYSNVDNKLTLISKELYDGMKIPELKSNVARLAFSKSVSKNMKMMGFKLKGRILIRIIMGLIVCKQYKIASKIILIK